MKFEEAVEKIEGAQVAGGDLIVVRDGQHILVGKHVQGNLIVADSDEARAVAAEVGIVIKVDAEGKPGPEEEGEPTKPAPTTHDVAVEDKVEMADQHGGKPKK